MFIFIDGGASVLNYPIAIFSENTNPSYITNMLDNDYSRDLYAQFGGNWKDSEEIIRDRDNIILGSNFRSLDPHVKIPIRNVFSFVWNFINVTYQSLLFAHDRDARYTITIDMGSILPCDRRYRFVPHETKQMIEWVEKQLDISNLVITFIIIIQSYQTIIKQLIKYIYVSCSIAII